MLDFLITGLVFISASPRSCPLCLASHRFSPLAPLSLARESNDGVELYYSKHFPSRTHLLERLRRTLSLHGSVSLKFLVVTLRAVVRQEELSDRHQKNDGSRDDERDTPRRLTVVPRLEGGPDAHHEDLTEREQSSETVKA